MTTEPASDGGPVTAADPSDTTIDTRTEVAGEEPASDETSGDMASTRTLRERLAAWSRSPSLIGIGVALLAFWRFYRFAPVWPTHVESWIAGDWGTHMLGWLHYRNSSFLDIPAGQAPNLGHPLGTSMIFTDSVPLVGVVLRPFSALLPEDFQYLGMYVFASYLLQGLFGARITARFTTGRAAIAGGAGLFVTMPAFLIRNVHPALTAHWLILAVLLAAISEPRARRWALVTMVALSSIIQPYIWMFVVVLLAGLLLDDVRRRASTWRQAAAAMAACMAGSLALVWYVGGFSSGFQSSSGGFGIGSANMLTFFADVGASRTLASIAFPETRRDGLAFLGLGVLLLLAVGLAAWALELRTVERPAVAAILRSPKPILTIVAALLLAVYAFSDRVYLGMHDVYVPWLYDPIRGMAERFRSSGRAIWPLMYLMVALAIWLVARAARHVSARPDVALGVVLVSAALVQYSDLNIPDRHQAVESFFFDQAPAFRVERLADERWQLLDDHDYAHMAVIPTALYGCNGGDANETYNAGRVALLSLEAYRNDMTFNSGFFSRLRIGVSQSCEAQNADAADGLSPDTVYVFTSVNPPPADARCGTLDGIVVCVDPANDDRFARSLAGS